MENSTHEAGLGLPPPGTLLTGLWLARGLPPPPLCQYTYRVSWGFMSDVSLPVCIAVIIAALASFLRCRRLQTVVRPACVSRCGGVGVGLSPGAHRAHRTSAWFPTRVGPLVWGNGAFVAEPPMGKSSTDTHPGRLPQSGSILPGLGYRLVPPPPLPVTVLNFLGLFMVG